MSTRVCAALLLAAVASMTQPQPTIGLSAQQRVVLGDPVEVDKVEGLYRHSIRVVNEDTGRQRTMSWTSRATEFHTTRVIDDRVILLGRLGSSAETISIIDLATQQPSAFVLCRSPSISGDGRHVAFLQFIPRHAPDELQRDRVLLLRSDVAKSNVAGAESEWVRNASSYGTVIFPGSLRSYDSRDAYASGSTSRILSPLLWTETPKRLVFATEDTSKRMKQLVVFDVDGSSTVRLVSSVDLPSLFMDPKASPANREAAASKLQIVSFELNQRSGVRITIAADALFVRTQVTVPVS